MLLIAASKLLRIPPYVNFLLTCFPPKASFFSYLNTYLRMKKAKLTSCLYFLLIYSVPQQSCSKYTVTTSQKDPADIHYKRKVAASYFWGIINKPHSMIDTTCGKAGLSDVKFTTNLGYSLLHVVTLGIVNLVRVEWKCQKEEAVIGFHP